MMNNNYRHNRYTINTRSKQFSEETQGILRNTYLLLSMTLLFSTVTAFYSFLISARQLNPLLTIVIYLGILFGIQAKKNDSVGIALTFCLTGFLGYTLGPIISFYVNGFSNGTELIILSLGVTALIFLALSLIALNSQKSLSQLGSFLSVGSSVCFFAIIANIFLKLPSIDLMLSIMISLVSGGLILWQINQIVHGGERNYITATVTLYLSILNIFLTMLQFLTIFLGRRD